jgi:hypothetical protein
MQRQWIELEIDEHSGRSQTQDGGAGDQDFSHAQLQPWKIMIPGTACSVTQAFSVTQALR